MEKEQRTIIRNKGLAWVSAITLGADAAGAVGTAAGQERLIGKRSAPDVAHVVHAQAGTMSYARRRP